MLPVPTQRRNAPDSGTAGTMPSPSERSESTIPPLDVTPSAKDTSVPLAASCWARGRTSCGGRVHDHADVRLGGAHVLELMHVEDRACERGHLVRGHHPRACREQQRGLHDGRDGAAPPRGDRTHAPRRVEHEARRVVSLGRRIARMRPAGLMLDHLAKARLHVLAKLLEIVCEPQQPELRHCARVEARVADGQAVGDHRHACGLRLEACDAARGVHEHVGRGQQIGHLVREAVDVDAWLLAEVAAELLRELVVAPCEADDARDVVHPAELADRALDVSDAPAATRDDHHPPDLR